ncbi:MAG: autotransporter domain-containing protein [Pseudomonadota bacterium]
MKKRGYRESGIGCIQAATLFFLVFILSFAVWGQEPAFYPNDPYFFYNPISNPTFPGQWHLWNQAPASLVFRTGSPPNESYTMNNTGVDANLIDAWQQGYTGKGIVIGIVDNGVEGTHPDIAPNYRADLSKNFSDNETLANAPQGPRTLYDNHGTCVAGVAAARGGNGIGGTGAAPYASLAGLRFTDRTNSPDDPAASKNVFLDAYYWKSGVNPDTGAIEEKAEIQIMNHSYGNPTLFSGGYEQEALALERTAANGVIHVWAAGNGRRYRLENATKEFIQNCSSVISVAALGSDGKYADYSSYGSCLFVTAPSNRNDLGGFQITTTDRAGADLGYNLFSEGNPAGSAIETFPDPDYTSLFGGSSASAPLVSGIMALGKEANPEMDIRMAKHALVETSTVVDPADSSVSGFGGWRINSAGNRFNPNYGFGNINAGALVEELRHVAFVTEQTTVAKSAMFDISIPDNDPAGVNRTFSLTEAETSQPIEGVEASLTFSHEQRGDLAATLTSPHGMDSELMSATSHLRSRNQDTEPVAGFSWTFLSNAFWGETGAGVWTLNMADSAAGNTGNWLGYNVTFLMGEMVLLTPGITTQGADIKALSLTLLEPDTAYHIPVDRFFRVTGNVLVEGGTLIVNGQLTESPDAFGNQFNLNSGRVCGDGVIHASRGFYNTGGDLSPGSAIGALTLNGDYHQGPAATLDIGIASPERHDLLTITGAADLDGTLQTTWTGESIPAPNSTFGTVLSAANGVNGRFSRLLTHITPTLLFQPKYDRTNELYLTTERNYAHDALPLTADQRSVGTMLNAVANETAGATGDLNTVLRGIDTLTGPGQAAAALGQLVPKGDAVLSAMAVNGALFQACSIAGRLGELRTGARGGGVNGFRSLIGNPGNIREPVTGSAALDADDPPPARRAKWGSFVNATTVFQNQESTSERMGYSATGKGMTLGLDYRLSDWLAAGLMLGGNTARAKLDDAGSRVELNGIDIGAYGTCFKGGFFVNGHLGYGISRYDHTRRIVFPGLDRTANADPQGRQFSAYGETGYDFHWGKWKIMPALSLHYTRLSVHSYTETGADSLNLQVTERTPRSLQSHAGGKVSYPWELTKIKLESNLHADYVHEFFDDHQVVTAQMVEIGIPFSTRTPGIERDFALIGTGITGEITNGISLHLSYDAQIGQDHFLAQRVDMGIHIPF